MLRKGLVLSGGGARGAYQAGVIKALEEILRPLKEFPFDVICGVSAGSINAAGLACQADNFAEASRRLEKLWGELEAERVIKTDIRSLGKIGATWLKDLSLGGVLGGGGEARSLLDTTPLRELLSSNIDFNRIQQVIDGKHIHALSISATNIYTNNSVSFVQGGAGVQEWTRHKRVSELTKINVEHLMASSAIPVFFPSGQIDGRHFTDGCIGNIAPLSPAVHLGASHIIAVGVRGVEMVSEQQQGPRPRPAIANLIGLLMNTVFMDSIEIDIQRMKRINDMMELGATLEGGMHHWRPIEVLQISPSEDVGMIARQYIKNIPRVVRYLMRGLGDQSSIEEIASYLLFDSGFCSRLIEMGYNDGLRVRNAIEEMFEFKSEQRIAT